LRSRKRSAQQSPPKALPFCATTAERVASEPGKYDAVLGFNYLHLVRDPQIALRHIHDLLVPGGLFISKTPCLGEMNVFIRSILLPAMRAVGLAPHVSVFGAQGLVELIRAAGFEIVATESHATKGKDTRPFAVARKT
jgi:SAM-dependent methyltransferase